MLPNDDADTALRAGSLVRGRPRRGTQDRIPDTLQFVYLPALFVQLTL
ncbi:hypothetical protein ZOD2009_17433 [Haladaptatus paucihalophilus DX253]|uniref:Uncharacterized protein n=1 Tax=Haladaptatus paucihalophilus DX253 TaxID=797209 RepID=E7QXE8_HALPU|nr:hypothetical protein ZOD2009_17433 [Haladaptatus paucihalophilus DX253]